MARRHGLTAFGLVVLSCVAAASGWYLRPHQHPLAAQTVPTGTAVVARTTLRTTTDLSGTIGHAGDYQLVNDQSGTVTAVPSAGRIVDRGQPAWEIDGVATYLFFGGRPAWRPFVSGMTPGPDVRQLEENLVALGFGANLLIDATFNWATAESLRQWQRATGQPVTGTLPLGRIVFAPGPIRVTHAMQVLGSAARPGEAMLDATSPDANVTADVPATQTQLVHVGDAVTVTLPTGTPAPGRISQLSAVAAGSSDSSGHPSGSGPQLTTFPAVVTLDRPADAAAFDQAPVTVSIIDREVRDALAVPVTALVALAGGGFAVWVDHDGHTRELVGITPGLYANSLVQVVTGNLAAGDHVEIPASS